ncbi:putative nucleoporin [Dioscorea sansibarensis]
MAIVSHVVLTCMAKPQDKRFLCPGGLDSDYVTCLDILLAKPLSNGACHSISLQLIMCSLRNESSEALHRRYDVPASILLFMFREEQDGDDDLSLRKIDRGHAELSRANFSMLRKEAHTLSDVDGWCSVQSFQRLMLIISHKYGKVGAQILLSMCVLGHLASCKAVDMQIKRGGNYVGRDPIEIDTQQLLVAPILRLVSSLSSLVHLIY